MVKNSNSPVITYVIAAILLGAITIAEFAIVQQATGSRGATLFWLVALFVVKVGIVGFLILRAKKGDEGQRSYVTNGLTILLLAFVAFTGFFTVPRAIDATAPDSVKAPTLSPETVELIETGGRSRTQAEQADNPAPADRSYTIVPPTASNDASGYEVADPATVLASLAEAQASGAPATDAGTWDKDAGATVFNTNCAACHQATGQGIPGAFPPLAEHAAELYEAGGGRDYLANVVVHGLSGAIDVDGATYNGAMPAWQQLSDQDLSNVLNYVITNWNDEPANFEPYQPEEIAAKRDNGLSEADVHDLREQLQPGAAEAASSEGDADGATAEEEAPEETATEDAGTEATSTEESPVEEPVEDVADEDATADDSADEPTADEAGAEEAADDEVAADEPQDDAEVDEAADANAADETGDEAAGEVADDTADDTTDDATDDTADDGVAATDAAATAATTWDKDAAATVFTTNCAACHQATGQGIPGAFPPLAEHAAELYESDGGRDYLVNVVLHGLTGAIDVNGTTYNGAMPAWQQFSDEEISNVLNYVVTNWNDEPANFEPYQPEDVAAQRDNGLTSADVHELREQLGDAGDTTEGATGNDADDAAIASADADAAALTWDPDVGARAYANCSACHQGSGQGIPGAFPPLANHAVDIYQADGGPEYLISVVLYGLQGSIDVSGMPYNGIMTAWQHLSDDEISNVLNYVVTNWNDEPADFRPIQPEDVAAHRADDLTSAEVHTLRGTLDF